MDGCFCPISSVGPPIDSRWHAVCSFARQESLSCEQAAVGQSGGVAGRRDAGMFGCGGLRARERAGPASVAATPGDPAGDGVSAVDAAPPAPQPVAGVPVAPCPPPPRPGYVRPKYYAWASLLERTFAIDVLACPDCGGRLRFVATIEDRAVIEKILRHLELPIDPPLPHRHGRRRGYRVSTESCSCPCSRRGAGRVLRAGGDHTRSRKRIHSARLV